MDWLEEYMAQQNAPSLMPGLLGETDNQQQQLAQLFNGADAGAQNMLAQSQQATNQAMQAKQAMNAQREAQENATMQQAQQAADAQKQKEKAAMGKLLSLGLTFATGGLGGGTAANTAGSTAAEQVGTEMLDNALAAANFTPEALGINAIEQAAPNVLNGIGWGNPLKKWF